MARRAPNLPFVEAQMIESRRKFGVVYLWLAVLSVVVLALVCFALFVAVKQGEWYEVRTKDIPANRR